MLAGLFEGRFLRPEPKSARSKKRSPHEGTHRKYYALIFPESLSSPFDPCPACDGNLAKCLCGTRYRGACALWEASPALSDGFSISPDLSLSTPIIGSFASTFPLDADRSGRDDLEVLEGSHRRIVADSACAFDRHSIGVHGRSFRPRRILAESPLAGLRFSSVPFEAPVYSLVRRDLRL